MGSNTEAKRKLIMRYGKKCFIEELGIRTKEEVETDLKRYTSKKQRAIMDELTYHHIIEKCKGGQATIQNGALLRNINHQWFNRLSKEKQNEINAMFQEYKKQKDKNNFSMVATAIANGQIEKPIKIDLSIGEDYIIIPAYEFTKEEYIEHKRKRNEKVKAKFEEIER